MGRDHALVGNMELFPQTHLLSPNPLFTGGETFLDYCRREQQRRGSGSRRDPLRTGDG